MNSKHSTIVEVTHNTNCDYCAREITIGDYAFEFGSLIYCSHACECCDEKQSHAIGRAYAPLYNEDELNF